MAGDVKVTQHCYSIDTTLDGFTLDYVYHSDTGDPTSTSSLASLASWVHLFLDSTFTGMAQKLSLYLSHSLDKLRALDYHVYNITGHLNGTPHGAPIMSSSILLTAPVFPATSTPVPEGVAGVLSFRRDYGTDVEFIRDPVTHKVTSRPRGQDRGRMYIGPLDGACIVADSGTYRAKLSTTFMNDCLKAFDGISTYADVTSHTWHLVQWSRKPPPPT
jgi:hypothetical protein